MTAINRSFSFKLAPSIEQDQQLRQFTGACRFVYNIALDQRRDWWRQFQRTRGKNISAATQSAELSVLRKEVMWLADVPRVCLEQALRDLDRAYSAFFSGRTKYPTIRRRAVNDSMRFQGRDIVLRSLSAKWAAVRLPKIGWVKFRSTRPIVGEVKNATISLSADEWRVSFACEIERDIHVPSTSVVGVDRGVTTTLALSTGEMFSMPLSLARIEAQKRKAQRVVSRRKKGSNRRRRAQRRVTRLQARQKRIRRDFHHRAALSIAERFGVAVLENLSTKSMTASAAGTTEEPGRNVRQKAGLNRAILNAGWSLFQTFLTYKMEQRGGQVVSVPASYTSQTCAVCGAIDAKSRESQARFVCTGCGHVNHADVNAAINIKRRWSTPLLDVEGLRQRPVEASTGGV